MLELRNVDTYYGNIQALKGISIDVNEGEIVTLIGANGAGKSTLLRVILGFLTAFNGRIFFKEHEITDLRPFEIGRMGIAHTFQEARIFPQMSVLENMMVARPKMRGDGFWDGLFHTRAMRISETEKKEKGYYYLDMVGLKPRANLMAGALSYGQKKRLEM
ncbi:MAG: ATP-binding cassette domain-containing protein, partial [Candidatus Marinimicrobia bacterium]|nr:ATP-binding cassette domain-containing protein [Candidatus Neomarinimicrobiota bacterium]